MIGPFTQEQADFLTANFVKKDTCNEKHNVLEKEQTEMKLTLTKISMQCGLNTKILACVGGGVLTLLLGAIGSVIFK